MVCDDEVVPLQSRIQDIADSADLARGTPHTERYGPEGATYWVARRGPRLRGGFPAQGY